MKLKQRIILGFLMIILVPMLLLAATLYGFSEAQHRSTSKNEAVQEADYDITIGETGVDGSGLRIMTKDLFFTALVILIFTSVSVGLWIYRSVATPLVKLRKATQNIKDGNLDFTVEPCGVAEINDLCEDFEEMRIRLKETAEEKVEFDKENKELISNISHDLKTPRSRVMSRESWTVWQIRRRRWTATSAPFTTKRMRWTV